MGVPAQSYFYLITVDDNSWGWGLKILINIKIKWRMEDGIGIPN